MNAALRKTISLLASLVGFTQALAQTLSPDFSSAYNARDLGEIPAHESVGAIAFQASAPNTLLFRVNAGDASQNSIHQVTVARGADQRITGLQNDARFFAAAPSANAATGASDGSLEVHSSGTILYTSHNDSTLGQIKAGSAQRDKEIVLDDFGYPSGGGGLAIVPAGLPGAGRFKVMAALAWADGALLPDGAGTFDLSEPGEWIELSHDPVGALYIRAGAPGFSQNSVLVGSSEDAVYAYQVNANGDPIPATKRLFVSNLPLVSGITLDPVTGDILVSARGNRVYAIGRFQVTPPTVRIVEPAPGASFAAPASLNILAEAGQQGGAVSKVDFYLGETLLGSEINAPYRVSTPQLAAGQYALRAVATGSGGIAATSAVVNVVLTNAVNQLPAVRLTAPTNLAHFNSCSSVTLRAEASDPEEGAVAYVDFYNGATLLGRDTTLPYELTITNALPGDYQFKAVARDIAGATATSATVSAMVMGPALHQMHTGLDPARNMLFCFNGLAGKQYIVETKTRLDNNIPWVPIRTNTIVAGSLMEFVDTQTASKPSAYFRVRSVE